MTNLQRAIERARDALDTAFNLAPTVVWNSDYTHSSRSFTKEELLAALTHTESALKLAGQEEGRG